MSKRVDVSAASYRRHILGLLEATTEGVLDADTVNSSIERAFSPFWTAADRRPIKGRNRAKWQNAVDRVKATCRTHQQFFYRRGVYVLNDPRTDPKILEWAQVKPVKDSYVKRCRKCGLMNRLAAIACWHCGRKFPKPNERINLFI